MAAKFKLYPPQPQPVPWPLYMFWLGQVDAELALLCRFANIILVAHLRCLGMPLLATCQSCMQTPATAVMYIYF